MTRPLRLTREKPSRKSGLRAWWLRFVPPGLAQNALLRIRFLVGRDQTDGAISRRAMREFPAFRWNGGLRVGSPLTRPHAFLGRRPGGVSLKSEAARSLAFGS